MHTQTDILVVGGGPAGMAAACAARRCGLDVTLVDEQPTLGGQLFRHAEKSVARPVLDTRERERGLALMNDFHVSGAVYLPEAVAWGLEGRSLCCTVRGEARQITGRSVIIATGGMERPVPFPGWTLPGVMSAGGADILLRSGGSLPASTTGPVVLAGNGPLLLLLAGHLLDAGASISAWLDTGHWGRRLTGGAMLPASVLDASYMGKGLRMALRVLRGKIRMIPRVRRLEALGDQKLEGVAFEAGGKRHELPAVSLLRHEGIIPRTHIPEALGAEHFWDAVQRCWQPVTDIHGATSVDGVHMAGDGAGVLGGDASMLKGTLAGIDAARRLGVLSGEEAQQRGASARKSLRSMLTARAFLRHMFAPNPDIFDVPDHTMVCRCECVTAGSIRAAVAEGYTDVNEIKRFTRCGMGPCQGRMCGQALAEIAAAAQGISPAKVGRLNIRQPFRPTPLALYCGVHAPH